MQKIVTNLWCDSWIEDAVKFWVSVFPNSSITDTSYYGDAGPLPAGTVLAMSFVLDGEEFVAINGGPQFKFSEAISLSITCKDQAEIDYYWDTLTADGGEESMCGWLKDKYGLSWQIVWERWLDYLNDPDKARAERAMAALLQMRKPYIAAIAAARDA